MDNRYRDVPAEFYQAAINKLQDKNGVHAETAIAGLARIAGTFLFRSFELSVVNLKPGSPVFSDIANTKGPQVVDTLIGWLEKMNVPRRRRAGTTHLDAKPHLSLMETQLLLEPGIDAIRLRHGLAYEPAAHLVMIAAGVAIMNCANVLDTGTAFDVAVYALVESSKSVPPALLDAAVGSAPGSWKARLASWLGAHR